MSDRSLANNHVGGTSDLRRWDRESLCVACRRRRRSGRLDRRAELGAARLGALWGHEDLVDESIKSFLLEKEKKKVSNGEKERERLIVLLQTFSDDGVMGEDFSSVLRGVRASVLSKLLMMESIDGGCAAATTSGS